MTYSESLHLLLSLERLGMKFGLEGIARLLRILENPHKHLVTIHVAGTNGKGSVASMLASVFTAAGYRTGLYTSPHLQRFEERIRIDGKAISQKSVAAIVTKLRPSIVKLKPTFFEATTALAFKYFADQKVDIAIVETGLGGRLDSTNILRPMISIITNIGLEHTEILGGSIPEIAMEKAGIIKLKTPCITGVADAKALRVIRKICRERNAPLVIVTPDSVRGTAHSIDGTVVDAAIGKEKLGQLTLSLAGQYQLGNLAIVLQTVDEIRKAGRFDLSEAAVREGLAHVQELSGLHGRLTTVWKKPRVVVDVAHNADATVRLVESLKQFGFKKATVVFGVMKDKNHSAMIRTLAAITDQAIAVAARSDRSRSASDVSASFAAEGCTVRAALSVQEGVRLALELTSKKGLVLITGSHFVVGEALPLFDPKRA